MICVTDWEKKTLWEMVSKGFFPRVGKCPDYGVEHQRFILVHDCALFTGRLFEQDGYFFFFFLYEINIY